MKNALIFIAPYSGHINPTIKFAKALKKCNVQVFYAGTTEIFNAVKHYGFQYLRFGSNHRFFFSKRKGLGYLETLLDLITYIDYELQKKELTQLIGNLNPDFIFLDQFFSTDLLILESIPIDSKIKIFFIQTMLSTYQDDAPPLNSKIIPSYSFFSTILTRLCWVNFYTRRFFIRVFNYIFYFGYGNFYLIKSLIKRGNLEERCQIECNKVFDIGFANIPELIFAPAEFDFPRKTIKKEQRYLGVMIEKDRIESEVDLEYYSLIKQIGLKKNAENLYLIYCSMGSRPEAHINEKVLATFLKKIINVCNSEAKYLLVLSNGEKYPFLKHYKSEKIYVFNKVPQLDLLPKCDLFITHGGLNSILESITSGVPVLVFPLNNNWDQNGNSSRVLYHKLGLRGDIRKDPIGRIATKISRLLTEHTYKKEVNLFRERIQEFNDGVILELLS